jgi:hypothetical protein
VSSSLYDMHVSSSSHDILDRVKRERLVDPGPQLRLAQSDLTEFVKIFMPLALQVQSLQRVCACVHTHTHTHTNTNTHSILMPLALQGLYVECVLYT